MRRDRRGALGATLAIALVAFVMLGMADGAVGVAWPSIRAVFSRPVSDLGIILAFGSVGYLTSSSGYGWIHSRLGTGRALGTGAALMSVALFGFTLAEVWPVVVGSALIFGLGGGLIDTGMNAHAALEFDVRSINLLHAAYGIGATIGPLVITLSLTAGAEWRGGYLGLAIAQLGLTATVWATRRQWVSEERDLPDLPPPTASRRRSIAIILLLFLVYTGVEVASGQWAFTLLSEGRGMGEGPAGLWVAAYWGGLTVGRLGFGVIGDRFDPSRLLDISVGAAMAGLALLWWDPSGLGYLGLPLAGLGLAGVFPTLVSLTPARIGRDRSTRMVGYQLAAANIGAATIPWIIGLTAQAAGLSVLGPALFAGSVALAVLHFAVDRTTRA